MKKTHKHSFKGYTGGAIPNTNSFPRHSVSRYKGPNVIETSYNPRPIVDHIHPFSFTVKGTCDCNDSDNGNSHPCPPCPPCPPPVQERCPFPTPNLDCPGFPRDGACVPGSLGHKPKQDLQSKLEGLSTNMVAPSVLTTAFFEIVRRFLNGEEPETELESDVYEILRELSPDALDICRCALNVINGLPASQKNALLTPNIRPTSELTPDFLVDLLADEILQVAGFFIMGDKEGLTNPRPGKVRRPLGTPEFPGEPIPTIFFINDIRTIQAIEAAGGGSPTSEEVERACSINQQNQQVCTVLTKNCPGNSTLPPDSVCMLVQHVLPGDLVKLQGSNYFSTDAKVVITSKLQPSLRRVVPTIVFGDVDTPVRDEQGNLINDARVKDKIAFIIPEDLPDGIYMIQVEVQNTNPDAGPLRTYTSDEEFLRILPPPTTGYQILAESLICVEETDGPGPDEVGLNFFTSILTRNPDTGDIDLSNLVHQEFRFENMERDNDTPDIRQINYAPVQANNLLGVNISIKGYEVDNEDFYKEKITEFETAFARGLESVWAKLAGSLVTTVGEGIAVIAAGAVTAAASAIIAAVAAVVVAAVALFYALWAPADPIIEDIIGLTLVELADFTNNTVPMPPQIQFTTPEDIRVVVDSLSKNIEFRQLRGYISEEEGSLYQIPLRYSRL